MRLGVVSKLFLPPPLEPENDKIFERLHTARTAIPNHLPAITLPTTTTNAHPSAPTRGLPSSYPVFFVFFLCLCGFPGSSGSGSGYLARRQSTKKALCRGVSTAQGIFDLLCCLGLRDGRGDVQLSCHFQDQ